VIPDQPVIDLSECRFEALIGDDRLPRRQSPDHTIGHVVFLDAGRAERRTNEDVESLTDHWMAS
jgi:hypothetical protein